MTWTPNVRISLFLGAGALMACLSLEVNSPLVWADAPAQAAHTEDIPASPKTSTESSTKELYLTPAGPTGRTLPLREIEIQALSWAPFPEFMQYRSQSISFPLIALRYGLFDRVTIEAGAGYPTADMALRWQVYRGESWSVSIEPRFEFQMFNTGSIQAGFQLNTPNTVKNTEISTLSLAASHQLGRSNEADLTLEIGALTQTGLDTAYGTQTFNGGVWSFPTLSYQADYLTVGSRASALLMHRFNSRHSMSFWLAANLLWTRETDSLGLTGNSYLADFIPTAGLGYQYVRGVMWLMFGMELGPGIQLRGNSFAPIANNTVYDPAYGTPISGNTTASVGFRF